MFQDTRNWMTRSPDTLIMGILPNFTVVSRELNQTITKCVAISTCLISRERNFCKEANGVIFIYVSLIYSKIRGIVWQVMILYHGTLPDITVVSREANKFIKKCTSILYILVSMERQFCGKNNDVILISVLPIFL